MYYSVDIWTCFAGVYVCVYAIVVGLPHDVGDLGWFIGCPIFGSSCLVLSNSPLFECRHALMVRFGIV